MTSVASVPSAPGGELLDYQDVLARYDPVLGLEVHVELSTATKMFCACANEFGAEPNTQVCPVCLGLPGSLPVLNEAAVESAIRIGLALNCDIAPWGRFARKNYFYPDQPKNYQISQYDEPIAVNGYLDVPLADGTTYRVAIERAHILDHVLWQEGKLSWLVPLIQLETSGEPAGAEKQDYFLPMGLAWEEREDERVKNLSTSAVVKIRQQGNVGIIGDAFADEGFCRAVVKAMSVGKEIATAQGKLQFRPTAAFKQIAGAKFESLSVDRPRGSSSNTVVTMGERLMLKGYRRLRVGLNPELEMGLYLTEVAHYPNCAALAGVLEYIGNDGQTRLLSMLQAYVPNQGDGWTYALEYVRRHLEQYRTTPAGDALPANAHEAFLSMVRVLAVRTAEMHRALAAPSKDPAFSPQALSRADIDGYRQRALDEAQSALEKLSAALETVPAADREAANRVLAQREQIQARLQTLAKESSQGTKIRIHGDYHLGQVLVTKNDFVIIDFEGEPGHSLEQRRAKHSALRDVAGMLRSFAYAQQSALRSVAHNEAEAARLAPLARAWEMETRAAFLSAYDGAARGAKLYDSLEAGRGLLGLFEMEKALYELRYEIGNRPTWVGIPLQGILDVDAGQ